MKKVFTELTKQFNKTSAKLHHHLKKIFSINKPTKELLEKIETVLISCDMGMQFSNSIIKQLTQMNFKNTITEAVVCQCIKNELLQIIKDSSRDLTLPKLKNVYTIILSGVNGSGKTTSVGKIASQLIQQKKKVLIAACDTFRASAVEQLSIWSKKANAEIFVGKKNNDPASIAFKALKKAQQESFDVLIIDTAGRIPNNLELMAELNKINNVIKKITTDHCYLHLLVLDATSGQAMIRQVEIFHKIASIDGLIITKLDGTAKAGALIPIIQKFQLPIYFIGTGECIHDLHKFSPLKFVDILFNNNQVDYK